LDRTLTSEKKEGPVRVPSPPLNYYKFPPREQRGRERGIKGKRYIKGRERHSCGFMNYLGV